LDLSEKNMPNPIDDNENCSLTSDITKENLQSNSNDDNENYFTSEKTCDPCDPANELLKYQLEKKERIMKGPFCPKLNIYPRSNQKEEQRQHNRSIMRRLIDVTLCLAKNGEPFRGHHENSSSVSKGLFLDFIDVLKMYDNVLENHLEKGALNAKYLKRSPKRHAVLERIVQETNIKLKTPTSLSTTRWACRSEAVSATEKNYDSKKYVTIFIFALYMMKPLLAQIKIVSAKLQTPNLNLLSAVTIAQAFKKSLKSLRRVSNKIDNNHTQHFSLDKKNEIKTFVYYVVLDDLFNGLENRFNQETLDQFVLFQMLKKELQIIPYINGWKNYQSRN
ncbi:zinc finger MYM-type protein 6-like, partial [Aphis craccivora]